VKRRNTPADPAGRALPEVVRIRATGVGGAPPDPLDLEWDRVAGTLTGQGTEALRMAAADCRHVGYVGYTPLGYYSTADPLRHAQAMAILLVRCEYAVPEVLAPYLPDVDDDTPIGAVN